MAHPESTILSKDTGRAQSAALSVLGLFAATQVALVGRALWLAGAGLSPLNGESTPPQAPPSVAAASSSRGESPTVPSGPPVPGQLAEATLERLPPAASTNTGWVVPTPGMLASDVVGTASVGSANQSLTPLPLDPEVAELLETVAQLRASGDTSGVMDLLRAAEGMDENNVAVLQEFAQTYEQMGLTDKAREYWRRIESQGPARAGAAYPLAQQRLGPSAAPAAPPAPTLPGAGLAMPSMPSAADFAALPKGGSQAGIQQADGAVLSVGSCQVVRDLAVTTGERQTLRIPIIRPANGDSQIEPTAVNVDVFFYDLVNGNKVEPTRADPPVANWVAAPVDWAGEGIEPLDVVYFLPQMTTDEIKNHGERRFHGYVVKLYYQNKLQVTAAEPSDLLDMDATPASAPAASGS
jgi:hypothetical protein